MDPASDALELVDNALSSIDTVMKNWKAADINSKKKFSDRVEKLKKWQQNLQSWKKEFLDTPLEERYLLLVRLYEIKQQLG